MTICAPPEASSATIFSTNTGRTRCPQLVRSVWGKSYGAASGKRYRPPRKTFRSAEKAYEAVFWTNGSPERRENRSPANTLNGTSWSACAKLLRTPVREALSTGSASALSRMASLHRYTTSRAFLLPCQANWQPNRNGSSPYARDDIARIVTLRTSGSTGEGKRLFFHRGGPCCDGRNLQDREWASFRPSGRPGARPASRRAARGASAICLSAPSPPRGECILCPGVGTSGVRLNASPSPRAEWPRRVCRRSCLSLARRPAFSAGGKTLSQVLFCADYAAPSLVASVENAWECVARRHYGLTETVYGGALECEERDGLHIMEGNYLFEILNPETLAPTPPGEFGEIIVTTLRTEGTPAPPLSYQRQGAASSREHAAAVPSSSESKQPGGSATESPCTTASSSPCTSWDDALFSVPWLADYTASKEDGRITISPPRPFERSDHGRNPAPQGTCRARSSA